ncbi:hypothetical protein PO909_014455 [Leuciscus waleckii]
MVLRTHTPLFSPSLAHPPEGGPSLSGAGHHLAPTSRPVETPGLVPGWEVEVLRGLPQAVVDTITSARAPSTRLMHRGGTCSSIGVLLTEKTPEFVRSDQCFLSCKRGWSKGCLPPPSKWLKFVQKFAVDVTLDPETADPYLILSDDGKQVSEGDIEQDVPENPKRFDEFLCVLAKQGFSSGRFYYEVQVKGKTEWDLGVARESINRKKKTITLSPEDGVWTVVLRNENQYKACESPPVSLSLRVKPEKVGVFVDYEEGLVSFYDVESRSHIYSFTDQTFTDKLYPYFSPGFNDEVEKRQSVPYQTELYRTMQWKSAKVCRTEPSRTVPCSGKAPKRAIPNRAVPYHAVEKRQSVLYRTEPYRTMQWKSAKACCTEPSRTVPCSGKAPKRAIPNRAVPYHAVEKRQKCHLESPSGLFL